MLCRPTSAVTGQGEKCGGMEEASPTPMLLLAVTKLAGNTQYKYVLLGGNKVPECLRRQSL